MPLQHMGLLLVGYRISLPVRLSSISLRSKRWSAWGCALLQPFFTQLNLSKGLVLSSLLVAIGRDVETECTGSRFQGY